MDPSPKFQLHDVGVLDDSSMNVTNNGIVPVVGVTVNPATGVGVKGGDADT